MNFDYNPPPTLAEFMADEDHRVRAVRGPVGSGKSTAMVMELLRRAAQQSPQADGVRRTRFVIVRNTLQQLRTTCWVTIQQILRPIVHLKISESTIYVKAGDIESEWLLLPLDTPENIQRLLSLELTGAWVSEFREIDPEIVQSVLSRCGRYPSRAVGGCDWYGVVMETNSFDEDSPWNNQLEVELPHNWGYFVQPGGLDTGAENVENLPESYYQDLMESNSEDWTAQYINNKIAPSLSGQAVFRKSFDPAYHATQELLEVSPVAPLCIGLDLGRTPTALICQEDWQGCLNVHKEIVGDDTGLEQFLRTELRPALNSDRYGRAPTYVVFDPAGIAKSQLSELNALDILKRNGFVGVPAPTNDVKTRLQAVEQRFLARDGIMINTLECPQLYSALKSRYRYKRKKSGQLDVTPEKLHPWSDLADALQYACLGINERVRGRAMRRLQPSNHRAAPAITPGAWT